MPTPEVISKKTLRALELINLKLDLLLQAAGLEIPEAPPVFVPPPPPEPEVVPEPEAEVEEPKATPRRRRSPVASDEE